MNEQDKYNELLEVIEKLNSEKKKILRSEEYVFGHHIKVIFKILKSLNLEAIIRASQVLLAEKKVVKKYTDVNPKSLCKCIQYKVKENAKVAIYFCITGGYDDVQIPEIKKIEGVDYFLIVDEATRYQKYENVFHIIEISKDVIQKGNIIANRYVKMHPHNYFSNYDYSIYLDGTIRVVSDIKPFITYCNPKTGIAMHAHNERYCVYKEAEACKILKKGNAQKIDQQMKKYKKEGFPTNYGMNEAAIIVTDLNNSNSKSILCAWYNEFINSGSMRDQLAWPYILWKKGYSIDDVGCLGNNIFENNKIEKISRKQFCGVKI